MYITISKISAQHVIKSGKKYKGNNNSS